MTYRPNYRTLIDQGRKSGLGTSELYRAMASHRPEAAEAQQADGNGYISDYGLNGRRVFRPIGSDEKTAETS